MWDFSLLSATRTLEKSMAFVLHRWLIYLGVGLAYIFGAIIGAGTTIGIGSLSSNPTAFAAAGAWVGMGIVGWVLYKFRNAFLTGVQARNAALLGAEALKQPIPKGKGQIEFARSRVAERFPAPQELNSVLAAMRAVLFALPGWRETPPQTQPQRWLLQAKGMLASTETLTLLGYHFAHPANDLRQSAREGLLILAAHFPKILRNRLYLFAFGWLGCLVTFPVMLVAVRSILAGLPLDPGIWPYVFAFLLAWTIKSAFLDAIALAAMLDFFLKLPAPENGAELADVLARDFPAFADICAQTAT
ncbi:hypothetical protein [Methylococcus geothermalis]|uniref:Uncharacterized protein n=1 Tax=Methylococcus geothermalis TaxID=2681310 RepID=A0A858Q4S3_9GAMM|nr:hypothetical protein [Methylococcus geothermalis]QJD28837.1 hypothetical protein GNH96_01905 [Methylococcus geothermalis]